MATTIQDAIKRLRFLFSSEGAEKVAADQNRVAEGQAKITQTAQTTERATLSLERSFANYERRFNSTIRAQQDYEKVQRQVNAAVAQNPALQARANEVLALAATHYGRASSAQSALATGLQAVQANAAATASRLGGLGSVLIGIGPAGIAAGAGIAVIIAALARYSQGVNDLADRAGKLVDFSETTRLSTDALQALTKAGAQVGVDAEKVGSSIERFTVQMEQLKKGSGDLYEAVRDVDNGLVSQLAGARDNAQAWNLLAEAYKRAEGNQRSMIARGAFGQRNLGAGRLLGETAEAGGLDAQIAKSRDLGAIEERRLRTLDQTKDRIDELRRATIDRFLLVGAEHDLKAAEEFWVALKKIQDWMDEFKVSDAWNTFVDGLNKAMLGPNTLKAMQAPSSPAEAKQSPVEARLLPAPNLGPGMDIGIAKYKEFLAVLGPAATQAEKLQFHVMELGQAALRAGVSQQTYNRALTALNTQATAGIRTRIADLNFETSLLGRSKEQVAAMRVEWDALRTVREQAIAAGMSEEQVAAAVEREAESMGDLLEQLKSVNAERDRQAKAIAEAAAAQSQLNQRRQEEARSTEEATRAYEAHKRALDQIADANRRNASTTLQINGADASPYGTGGEVYPGSRMYAPQSKTIENAGEVLPGVGAAFSRGLIQGFINSKFEGGFTSTTKGLEVGFDQLLNKGTSLIGALDQLFKGKVSGYGFFTNFDFSQAIPLIQRVVELLPKDQQASQIERVIGQVSEQPATLAREELLKQLRDKLEDLTKSTDELSDTMRDVLSPLYGADPRTTHIGYRAGSVYRPQTTLTDAQLGGSGLPIILPGAAGGADFTVPGGYSASDNMLLPVASGEKIKVNRDDSKPTIVVNAPITIESMSGNRSETRETMFQINQQMAAAVRQGMSRG